LRLRSKLITNLREKGSSFSRKTRRTHRSRNVSMNVLASEAAERCTRTTSTAPPPTVTQESSAEGEPYPRSPAPQDSPPAPKDGSAIQAQPFSGDSAADSTLRRVRVQATSIRADARDVRSLVI
jgi:hypothetical protein